MPYDFNLTDDEQPTEQEFEAALAPEPVVQAESELSDLMEEAKRRFAKAQYYDALLTESIFDGDDSVIAEAVVAEIRVFIKERLAVLLGVKPDVTTQAPVKELFSEEEAKVLKQVAARLLKKPELAQVQVEPPTLKKVGGPAKTQTKAAVKVPETKPTLKKTATSTAKPQPRKAKNTTFSGETIVVDGVTYEKATDERGEHWVRGDGQKFLISDNGSGQSFLKNVTPVAKPVGSKPVQSLTSDMMAMVSARSVQQAIKMDPVAAGNIHTVTSK